MDSSAAGESCVLIVDDEEDVRETLRDAVEMMGCAAIMADSGENALAFLARSRPCLVILDTTPPPAPYLIG